MIVVCCGGSCKQAPKIIPRLRRRSPDRVSVGQIIFNIKNFAKNCLRPFRHRHPKPKAPYPPVSKTQSAQSSPAKCQRRSIVCRVQNRSLRHAIAEAGARHAICPVGGLGNQNAGRHRSQERLAVWVVCLQVSHRLGFALPKTPNNARSGAKRSWVVVWQNRQTVSLCIIGKYLKCWACWAVWVAVFS